MLPVVQYEWRGSCRDPSDRSHRGGELVALNCLDKTVRGGCYDKAPPGLVADRGSARAVRVTSDPTINHIASGSVALGCRHRQLVKEPEVLLVRGVSPSLLVRCCAAAFARAARVNIPGVTLSAACSRCRGAVHRDLEGSRNP